MWGRGGKGETVGAERRTLHVGEPSEVTAGMSGFDYGLICLLSVTPGQLCELLWKLGEVGPPQKGVQECVWPDGRLKRIPTGTWHCLSALTER